jgi:protein TonB
MERHFTFPVLVAAAIHGGLLFGWPRGDVPQIKHYVPMVFGDPLPPMPPPAEPEIEVVPEAEQPRGNPDAYRPAQEDTPRVADIRDFTVPITTVDGPILDRPSPTIVPPGPRGPRDGSDFGGVAGILPSTFLDNAPRTRSQPPIAYPYEAKRSGQSGTVTVEFTVDETGRVLEPRVVDSTDRVFEAAALAGVAKWRFEPGRRAGRIVRFRMAVPIQFSLNE